VTAQPIDPSPWDVSDADLTAASSPIWDECFADTDNEIRFYLRELAAHGPVAPTSEAELDAEVLHFAIDKNGVRPIKDEFTVVISPEKKPAKKAATKKPTPRKPTAKKAPRKATKPNPLSVQAAELADVAARVKADLEGLGS
jgi:hypothetical protein